MTKLNIKAILVLCVAPIIAAIWIPLYASYYGFSQADWIVFSLFLVMTGLSITAGYHRLWSHKAYQAHWIVRVILMLFGSAALQNSVFKWASDHRYHHQHVDDNEKDPYSAKKGFLYSHIGWMLIKPKHDIGEFTNIKDLKNDPILQFQHKHYAVIALVMCFGLPALIGWTYGHVIGALLLAGLLRLILNHHFTFFINSLAHLFGTRPFSDANTARDNPLISLVTYGEGYHNFHHKFAGDYRNGIKWYDFDPTKWLIASLAKLHLVWQVKITPEPLITKAKLTLQYNKLADQPSQIALLKHTIEEQYNKCLNAITEYSRAYTHWVEAKKTNFSTQNIKKIKRHYRSMATTVDQEIQNWRRLVNNIRCHNKALTQL